MSGTKDLMAFILEKAQNGIPLTEAESLGVIQITFKGSGGNHALLMEGDYSAEDLRKIANMLDDLNQQDAFESFH